MSDEKVAADKANIAWNALRAPELPVFEGENVWESIEARIVGAPLVGALNRSAPIQPRATTRVAPTWRYLSIVAAMIITVVGIKHLPHTSRAEYRTVTTERGQRARIQLPDGSTALLAPETKVRYAADFGKSSRNVEIQGQALFTITHTDGVPFTVTTGSVTTRVLGTSFSIRHYAGDAATSVVVAEGKVAVSDIVLTPGNSVRISDNGQVSIDRAVNIATALAWTQGRLEFTRAPLSAVVADAARMYNLNIQISSPKLASQLVTGAIDQSSPDDAVAMLAATFGVRAERSGNTITLTEK